MNELYTKYKAQEVFRKDQVVKDFPHLNRNALDKKIEQAKRVSKVIKSVGGRRGIYFIVEPGQDYKKAAADMAKVAAHIAPGAIICYASALSLLGKSHSIHNIMYVSSKKRFRELRYQGILYRHVIIPHRTFMIEELSYRGTILKVTSLERTLIDCLNNLKYAGGFEQLYRSFEGVPYLNSKKIEECLRRFSSPLLNSRAGLFIEFFKKQWGINEQVFARLQKKTPSSPDYFLERHNKGGKLVRRWNLIVPQDVLTMGGVDVG